MSDNNLTMRIVIPIATVVTLVINGLATAVPLGGLTTGEISDLYPTLVTPAGYVFSIWGIIYAGLVLYTIFQALNSQAGSARLRAIGWWYVASCFFNSTWILFWQYQILGVTIFLMLGILVTLSKINLILKPTRNQTTWAEYITTDLPFDIYLAWICIATIANFSVIFWSLGWRGDSEVAASIIILIIAAGIAFAALWDNRQNPKIGFALVPVWAFIGIYVKHGAGAPAVATTALILAIIVALGIVAASGYAFTKRGQLGETTPAAPAAAPADAEATA